MPATQETQVQSLYLEDTLEKEMATHSTILAWEIPSTEQLCWLQSMGSQRVGHDWAINTFFLCKSLTSFFDVWLLTNFKSHYYLCPFCPTTRQVKKAWMGQESLFRHEWEVQTMEAPAHGNGNPCPSLTSSPPKSPKSLSFFSPLQPFLDQHAWSTLEPTLLFPERLMMWIINLY